MIRIAWNCRHKLHRFESEYINLRTKVPRSFQDFDTANIRAIYLFTIIYEDFVSTVKIAFVSFLLRA